MREIHIKLVLNLINDREEHDLYELHEKYRLTPTEARNSIKILGEMGIIDIKGRVFSVSDKLTKKQIGTLYKSAAFREIELDQEEITILRNRALEINALYLPNLNIIDESLIFKQKNVK